MIATTMPITIVERCHGWEPTSHPSTGPEHITAATITVKSTPAVAGLSPSPRTRKG